MASVLIDRGLGVLAALVYVAAGLSLAPGTLDHLVGSRVSWHWPGWAVAGLVVVSAAVAATLVARSGRIRQVWCDGLRTLIDLTRSPRGLAGLSGLALVSQASIIILWYTLARGMNLALPPATFLWAVPLVALGSLLPVSVSGLGVREAVWLALLARSPVPQGSVVAFSLLYFVCTALVGVLGGILSRSWVSRLLRLIVSSFSAALPGTRAARLRDWWPLAAAIVVGAALRGFHLGANSLWTDEFATLFLASNPVGEILKLSSTANFVPPLYFVMVHGCSGCSANRRSPCGGSRWPRGSARSRCSGC